MKKISLFGKMLTVVLLSVAAVGCEKETETETEILFSQLPTEYNVVNTWFSENDSIPTPPTNTIIEIEKGAQTEAEYNIGAYFVKIDIEDYYVSKKEFDIEFYLNEENAIIAVIVNDTKMGESATENYAAAEAQLRKDYSNYTIDGDVMWQTERDYQVATFAYSKVKSSASTITAWYSVDEDKATREMDNEVLGSTLPEIIRSAFEATAYSDANIWKIDDIEVEHNYNNNGISKHYEVDLENIANPNHEAELTFNEKGELIYTKEDIETDGTDDDNDDDDNDDNDDRFVINAELKAAVEKAVPGAIIIDAELDDDGKIIEVDAILGTEDNNKEIELEFTLDYVLLSNEIESETTYGALAKEFSAISAWFAANAAIVPAPLANTEVEITEGEQTEDDNNIGTYHYEVKIDDYESSDEEEEYEVEFYLNSSREIIAVIVNDEKKSL